MAVDTFRASVQYGDWKGTSAADGADTVDAAKWLRNKGLIKEDEFLVGIELWAGEYHGAQKDPVYAHFLLAEKGGYENVKAMIDATADPVPLRRVDVNMSLAEFFGLFKRFSVAFSRHDMLGQREYQYPEA